MNIIELVTNIKEEAQKADVKILRYIDVEDISQNRVCIDGIWTTEISAWGICWKDGEWVYFETDNERGYICGIERYKTEEEACNDTYKYLSNKIKAKQDGYSDKDFAIRYIREYLLIDNCEDGKVVLALWIAEITLKNIKEKNKDYYYCRNSVDLCWDWLVNRNVSKVQIAERISNDGKAISDIVNEIEDIELANKYGTILICVSYVAWQAYNYDNDYFYPQDLECVNDEYLEELIIDLIEEKTLLHETYEMMLNYIKENYSENNKIDIKQKIMNINC